MDKNKKLVVVIDPPWPFAKRKKGTKFGAGAEGHYPLMKITEIFKLFSLIGKLLSAKNCAMFIWSTNSHTKACMECIDYLDEFGFRFATLAFNWVKINKDGTPFKGPGSYTSSGEELCWLAVKGSMPPVEKLVDGIILAQREEHSKKPEEFFNRVQRIYPDNGDYEYLEIFSRKTRPGWTTIGNGISGKDIFDEIKEVF